MAYLLSLDQGTTSSRAIIFNEKGEILSLAQKPFKQYFPSSGLVEHDAEEIWTSQYAVSIEAMAKAKIKAAQITAIGITNQRETTILWDKKTSQPISRAIVWQDRRTSQLCDQLKAENKETIFREKTGLLLDPYFSGTKIRWMLDNIPQAREKAERGELAFGTVDSWLVWKLTDGACHLTDVSNASRTLLFNIHTLAWDEELLQILQIPKSLLPSVRSSSEIYGKTAPHIFTSPIPIAGIAGDQQSALFGQKCLEVGQAKATYGTGCFILMNTGEKPILSKSQLLTTIAWKIDSRVCYALEGSVFIAGAAIQWFKDNLGAIQKSSDIGPLAESVSDTGGVMFVPAFTGLGAPYWDPQARGAILGISRGTTKAHLARAILESIAFSAKDVLIAMEKDAKRKIIDLHVDGGVVASNLLMQLQADLIQSPVQRPQIKELTALGVALLAGLATNVWNSPDEFQVKIERRFESKISPKEVELKMARWAKAVKRTLRWEES